MAMARKPRDGSGGSEEFWVTYTDIAESPGHPFYERLNRIFDKYALDRFCEDLCAPYYEKRRGRPSIRPGVYFRNINADNTKKEGLFRVCLQRQWEVEETILRYTFSS